MPQTRFSHSLTLLLSKLDDLINLCFMARPRQLDYIERIRICLQNQKHITFRPRKLTILYDDDLVALFQNDP